MTCSIDGCARPVKARGWCGAHYVRWQRHGDPLGSVPRAKERTALAGEKWCSRCGAYRLLADFSPNAATSSGYQAYCREHMREYHAELRTANPEQARAWGQRRRERLRSETLAAYGGVCACCGESEPDFLCIDHIDGVIPPEDYRSNGQRLLGDRLYARLKRTGWPGGYRVLCWNCNTVIAQRGRCPHERHLKAVSDELA